MTKWSLTEILIFLVCVPALGYGVYYEMGVDNRPDDIKYVSDPRNGCKLTSTIELANHQYHVRDTEYRYKYLETYMCANNQTAALIVKEPTNESL